MVEVASYGCRNSPQGLPLQSRSAVSGQCCFLGLLSKWVRPLPKQLNLLSHSPHQGLWSPNAPSSLKPHHLPPGTSSPWQGHMLPRGLTAPALATVPRVMQLKEVRAQMPFLRKVILETPKTIHKKKNLISSCLENSESGKLKKL